MGLSKFILHLLAVSIVVGVIPNALILNNLNLKIPIYFFDVVMFFIFFVSLFIKKHRILKIDLALILVFGYLFLLNLLNLKLLLGFSSFFYLARVFIYLFSYSFFVNIYKNKPNLINQFLQIVIYLSVPIYLLVFLNYPNVALKTFDPHIARLYGLFIDPNFYSVLLCLFYVVLIGFLTNKKRMFLNLTYIFLVVVSIFLTFSRLGIILFLLTNLLLSFRHKKPLLTLPLVGFVLILATNIRYLFRFLFINGNYDSFLFKVWSFLEGLILYDKILLPTGFNNLKVYRYFLMSNTNNVSSFFDFLPLTIIITGGVFLCVAFCLALIAIYKNIKLPHYTLLILLTLFASLVMNVFFNPVFLILFLVFVVGGLVEKKY
jgi:hypothetical protein